MKGSAQGIAITLALVAAAYLFLFASVPSVTEKDKGQLGLNLYASGEYGFSFAFPASYIVSEEEGETCSESHTTTLIQQEDAIPVVAGGEGPRAITVEVCGGSGAPQTIGEWLSLPESNYALGDGKTVPLIVDGAEAVRYTWSGLYEGETIVFMHNERVISVSVTYLSPSDAIREDYNIVLESFTLR